VKETNSSSGADGEASTTSMVLYGPRIETLSSLSSFWIQQCVRKKPKC